MDILNVYSEVRRRSPLQVEVDFRLLEFLEFRLWLLPHNHPSHCAAETGSLVVYDATKDASCCCPQ